MKNRSSNARTLNHAALATGLTATMFAATAPAAHAVGGDTPLTGTLISNIAFTDTGTTVGFASDVDSLVTNPSVMRGPDVFYKFTVQTAGTINFTVTPSSGYDTAIYLLQNGAAGSNAVVSKDAGGPGAAETISGFALVAGSTYYLGVDSYYAATDGSISAGTYSLTMSGTAVLTSAAVPEPGTFGLAALGAFGLVLKQRKRKP